MYVYFIRAIGSGFMKIGMAERPHVRLTFLQTASPFRLELVGAIGQGRGAPALEQLFHDQFKPYKVRGEWHREERELASFVAASFPNPPYIPQYGAEFTQDNFTPGFQFTASRNALRNFNKMLSEESRAQAAVYAEQKKLKREERHRKINEKYNRNARGQASYRYH